MEHSPKSSHRRLEADNTRNLNKISRERYFE